MDKKKPFSWEVHLDLGWWENIPENSDPWFQYNNSQDDRVVRRAASRKIIRFLFRHILSDLTLRQQKVIKFFLNQRTQKHAARKLGVSQPTISQHLYGKKRNGLKIGGAVRRIKKKIEEKTRNGTGYQGDGSVLTVLNSLLERKITRRHGVDLLKTLVTLGRPIKWL